MSASASPHVKPRNLPPSGGGGSQKASMIADELQIEYDLKHEEEDPDLSPTVIFQVVSLDKVGK